MQRTYEENEEAEFERVLQLSLIEQGGRKKSTMVSLKDFDEKSKARDSHKRISKDKVMHDSLVLYRDELTREKGSVENDLVISTISSTILALSLKMDRH
jgi:hypothetical protein